MKHKLRTNLKSAESIRRQIAAQQWACLPEVWTTAGWKRGHNLCHGQSLQHEAVQNVRHGTACILQEDSHAALAH